jgi:nitroreductase
MMLAAASMNLGTVWVSVREEVEPELRKLFQVPPELRLLWVVPIGHARSWPKAKPRRSSAAFTHWETYDNKKLRPGPIFKLGRKTDLPCRWKSG